MQCDRCRQTIAEGETHEHLGQILCEDCYMDALSPAKACDPWAVHSAKTFESQHKGPLELNDAQRKILNILKETGGIKPGELAAKLQLNAKDLEREMAALRHMEKLRGELRDGVRYVRLWE